VKEDEMIKPRHAPLGLAPAGRLAEDDGVGDGVVDGGDDAVRADADVEPP
jgi:hypothetical protein